MRYDTREAPRIKLQLAARWEGVAEQREATITSLSWNGCFLLSGGEVKPDELLRIEIQLPNEDPVFCWGEVTDQAYDIGFAVRFTSPSDDQDQARLIRFVEKELAKAS
jgi:PilZ domain